MLMVLSSSIRHGPKGISRVCVCVCCIKMHLSRRREREPARFIQESQKVVMAALCSPWRYAPQSIREKVRVTEDSIRYYNAAAEVREWDATYIYSGKPVGRGGNKGALSLLRRVEEWISLVCVCKTAAADAPWLMTLLTRMQWERCYSSSIHRRRTCVYTSSSTYYFFIFAIQFLYYYMNQMSNCSFIEYVRLI